MHQFHAVCEFNKILVIESLREEDMHTGQQLYSDTLENLCKQNDIASEIILVGTRQELLTALIGVQADCPNGVKPILHFEVHGSEDRNGLILQPPNELVTWAELKKLTKDINDYCNNNLTIVMAVCYGFEAIKEVNILESTPYYALIGPVESVSAGFICDKFPSFYKIIVENLNLNDAFQVIQENYSMYLSESLFVNVLSKYFIQYCSGTGKDRRIKDLMKKLKKKQKGKKLNYKKLKELAERELQPKEEVFEKYKKTFLMSDREVNKGRFEFSYNEIIENLNL
ncbi:hypothetical protein MASR1M45_00010 [Candidatus Kapaibacterium sp.]